MSISCGQSRGKQHFNDPVTLEAVNDVENLTQGLARTIWQKIMILDRVHGAG